MHASTTSTHRYVPGCTAPSLCWSCRYTLLAYRILAHKTAYTSCTSQDHPRLRLSYKFQRGRTPSRTRSCTVSTWSHRLCLFLDRQMICIHHWRIVSCNLRKKSCLMCRNLNRTCRRPQMVVLVCWDGAVILPSQAWDRRPAKCHLWWFIVWTMCNKDYSLSGMSSMMIHCFKCCVIKIILSLSLSLVVSVWCGRCTSSEMAHTIFWM
jgi:hypothetical protein